jgi:hypothetical protein
VHAGLTRPLRGGRQCRTRWLAVGANADSPRRDYSPTAHPAPQARTLAAVRATESRVGCRRRRRPRCSGTVPRRSRMDWWSPGRRATDARACHSGTLPAWARASQLQAGACSAGARLRGTSLARGRAPGGGYIDVHRL